LIDEHLQCRIIAASDRLTFGLPMPSPTPDPRSPTPDSRPLTPSSSRFPDPRGAGPEGLVYIGGSLEPDWLLDAYRHGIFPWPLIPGVSRVQWWSPDPRAIFEFDKFHASRRLLRTCRSGRFEITSDQDFAGVLKGCATAQKRRYATWLNRDMMAAYQRLFKLGHAHSVEVRHEGQLVGGTYGVAIGGLYAGESMFYHQRDASKVALVHLVQHLRERNFQLFDIQQLTAHSRSLGAIEIPRREYLRRLAAALGHSPEKWLPF
jgi:leucyl/phenylalanyl-tRNA--protein transferase